MGKTRNIANIPILLTTDLTNNFVGIGSTTPTSKLNVVGITSVGVGKSFTSVMNLTGNVTKAHHINTTDNVNLSYDIIADSFSSSTTGSILGCGFTTAAVICDRKAYDTDGGAHEPGDTWLTRDLNHEEQDIDNIVSITSNKFTLLRGTYLIKWAVPVFRTYSTTTRLRQTIAGSGMFDSTTTTIIQGNQTYSKSQGYYAEECCEGQAFIKQTEATADYFIQSKSSYSNNGTYARGLAGDVSGIYNYYTYVTILKGDL